MNDLFKSLLVVCGFLSVVLLPLVILVLIGQGTLGLFNYYKNGEGKATIESWVTSMAFLGITLWGYIWCAVWYIKALNAPVV